MIFAIRRWHPVSSHQSDKPSTRVVPYGSVVEPGDPHQFVRILAGDADAVTSRVFAALPCTLADTRLEVSTGKVVDFRATEHLRMRPGPETVPLIYPGNLKNGASRGRWKSGSPRPLPHARTRRSSWSRASVACW